MLTIIRKISKLKLLIYILFSLLYSFQGLLMSFLIQAAGKLDVEDTRMVLIFGAGGVLLFVFIYACMYINNVMIRAIIEDFNILVSKKAIEKFYQKKTKIYAVRAEFFFDSGYSDVLAGIPCTFIGLSGLFSLYFSICSLSSAAECSNRFIVHNWWLLDDYTSVCI